MSVKVRFPPSPTGRKHIGNYRTFLFSWLFARSNGGTVALRFEDTDRERSSIEFERGITDMLTWLGLDWDEGPYRQSDRLDIYAASTARLVGAGRAYPCWCTDADLDEMRTAARAEGRPQVYDGRCRARAVAGEGPAALRFAISDPLAGGADADDEIVFVDAVRGEVRFSRSAIGDRVIVRADGTPVYQLAVTVDDFEMGVTHVLRGEDLMSSTPLQIALAEALGRERPATFGHFPLIVGPDKAKLSTRHGPVAAEDYREDGVLAEAIVNYLALVGWSHPDGREVFDLTDLVDVFSLDRVGKTPALFDPVKLDAVNLEWLQRLPAGDLATRARPFLEAALGPVPPERILPTVDLWRTRVKRLSELPGMIGFLFIEDPPEPDPQAWAKTMAAPEPQRWLDEIRTALAAVEPFTAESIAAVFSDLAESLGVKLRVLQAVPRLAVTGRLTGPPLWDSLALLGRDQCLARLNRAAARASVA